MSKNPYESDRTLARVWDEGYNQALEGRQAINRELSEDERVLLQMSCQAVHLDGLKWVGEVPPDDRIFTNVIDSLSYEVMTANGTWGITKSVPHAGKIGGFTPYGTKKSSITLNDAVLTLKNLGEAHRQARILHDVTIRTQRVIGKVHDGVQTWNYDEDA